MTGRTWPGRISRRQLLRSGAALAGTAAVGGLIPACAGASPSPSSAAGRRGSVAIAHWDYWVSQSPYLENEIRLFEQAHPGITIKRTINASTTYDQVFGLAQRGGRMPDTFILPISTPPLNDQVARGWLHPLNQWTSSSWQRQFPGYSFVEGSNTFAGKIYTAPFSGHGPFVQLYVHTGIFKQVGLTNKDGSVRLPTTWDDVTRAAETITKKGGGSIYGIGFGNGAGPILPFWIEVFTRAAGSPGGEGGQDLRTGKYTFGGDRNYADFIRLLTEWRDRGYVYPSSMSITDEVARAYFERGRFGMTVGGVWLQPEFTTHKFHDYELTTLIGPESKRKGYFYSTPGGTLAAMAATTKHPAEAWEWLSWLYSPAAGKRWTETFNEDLSIFPQDDDPTKIGFKPFAEYVRLRSLDIPGPQAWVRNKDAAFVVVNPVQPDLGTVLTGIYSGQITDVHAALTELDGRWTAALDQGIKSAQQKGYKVSLSDYAFPDWDITKPYKWSVPEYLS